MAKTAHQKLTLEGRRGLSLLAACSFFLGGALGIGLLLFAQAQYPASTAKPLRESNISTAHSNFKFIDPLLGTKGFNNPEKYSNIQNQVASYIASEAKNGLKSASVDFRDINEAGGFVLNPTELYTPASLNKVPVMMAYYKIAETEPGILSEELTYSGAVNADSMQEIKPGAQIVPGATYTIEELIQRMIRYSDNNATGLLTQHLKDSGNYSYYTSVFSDLGTNPSVLDAYTDNVAVRNYSMFLRALYNATYLSRTDSEHALKLLSEADFSEGIESGVPNNILVSEKFGEVRLADSNGTLLGKELHNCGIIYYPGHPYLLCIMTKAQGDNLPLLESEIASISRIIYKGMQGFYP